MAENPRYLIAGDMREPFGGTIRFQPNGAYLAAFAFMLTEDDPSGKRPGVYVAVGVGNDPVVTERLSWASPESPLPVTIFGGAEWVVLPAEVAGGLFSDDVLRELAGSVPAGPDDCETCKTAESPAEGSADQEGTGTP